MSSVSTAREKAWLLRLVAKAIRENAPDLLEQTANQFDAMGDRWDAEDKLRKQAKKSSLR